MTHEEFKASMRAIDRVAEILIQLPLDECLEIHEEALKRPDGDQDQNEKDAKKLTDSKRQIEALITAKLIRMENRANFNPINNANNAIASAAWAALLMGKE